MADYEFELPMPISVNQVYRSIRGRSVLSEKTRKYREKVAKKMKELGLNGELIGGHLEVVITLHHSQNRVYDVDNYFKSLFDALTSCDFWVDDSQIYKCTAIKGEKVKGGKVAIKINQLD